MMFRKSNIFLAFFKKRILFIEKTRNFHVFLGFFDKNINIGEK